MTTSIHSSLSSSSKSLKRHITKDDFSFDKGNVSFDTKEDVFIENLKLSDSSTSIDMFSSSSSFPSSSDERNIDIVEKPQSVYLSISMPTIPKVSKPKSYDNYSSLKMFVFDCDNMITRLSLVNIDISDILDMKLEKLVEDPKFFTQSVKFLIASGYKVSIASYGYKDKILILMQRLFAEYSDDNDCPFNKENIITPLDLTTCKIEDFPKVETFMSCNLCNHAFSKSYTMMPFVEWKEGYEPPIGKGKWLMLERICEKNQLYRHQIMLLDDSVTNCFQAIANGYNAKVVKNISRKKHFMNLKHEDFSIEEFLQSWKIFIQDMSY
jgi:hypothetical protein